MPLLSIICIFCFKKPFVKKQKCISRYLFNNPYIVLSLLKSLSNLCRIQSLTLLSTCDNSKPSTYHKNVYCFLHRFVFYKCSIYFQIITWVVCSALLCSLLYSAMTILGCLQPTHYGVSITVLGNCVEAAKNCVCIR